MPTIDSAQPILGFYESVQFIEEQRRLAADAARLNARTDLLNQQSVSAPFTPDVLPSRFDINQSLFEQLRGASQAPSVTPPPHVTPPLPVESVSSFLEADATASLSVPSTQNANSVSHLSAPTAIFLQELNNRAGTNYSKAQVEMLYNLLGVNPATVTPLQLLDDAERFRQQQAFDRRNPYNEDELFEND